MSRRADDLTGQVFGRWTVLRRATAEDRGRPKDAVRHYLCRCACGREKIVDGYNLRKGLSTSCGCKSADTKRGTHIGKHKDIAGQVFGELTALSFVRRDTWRFACSCGRIVEARPSYVAEQLRKGVTPSCGHVFRANAAVRMADYHKADIQDGVSVSKARRTMAGKRRSSNTSGCTGVRVRHNAGGDTYSARIEFGGRSVHLGTFATFDEAVSARKESERKYLVPIVAAADREEGGKS